MGWEWGLQRKATDARGFDWDCRERTGRAPDPVFADQSDEGIILERRHQWRGRVPLMVVILLLVAKSSVMGAFTANRWIIILGWAAALVMGAAAARTVIPD